ncbi:MAG: site-specific integrase, partial [Actinomycetota bacterium]|nr:site-specific integrase [Actinomycetota bacterium]
MGEQLVEDFLGYLAVERGASVHTISAYGGDLRAYLSHLSARHAEPLGASRDDVIAFVRRLQEQGMAPSTVERKIAAVKSFHAFLVREGLTANHPTLDVALPKVPERLPEVISIEDAERLLSQPFPEGPVGYRD